MGQTVVGPSRPVWHDPKLKLTMLGISEEESIFLLRRASIALKFLMLRTPKNELAPMLRKLNEGLPCDMAGVKTEIELARNLINFLESKNKHNGQAKLRAQPR